MPGVISENTHGMTFRPAAFSAHWRCSHRSGSDPAATMVAEPHTNKVRLLMPNGSLKYVSQSEQEEQAYRSSVVGRSHDYYVSLGDYDRGNEKLIVGEHMPALRAKLMREEQGRLLTNRSSESVRRGPARVTRGAPKARG